MEDNNIPKEKSELINEENNEIVSNNEKEPEKIEDDSIKNTDTVVSSKKDFINGPVKVALIIFCIFVCFVAIVIKFGRTNSSDITETEAEQITSTSQKEDLDKSSLDDSSVEVDNATTDVSNVAENILPSMVSISVLNTPHSPGFNGISQNNEWNEETELLSPASGVIIGNNEEEIWILTNEHVVCNGKSFLITFCDNEKMTAYYKGSYAENDIAVLSVKTKDLKPSTLKKIKRAKLGNSSKVKVGQNIIAVGNALGQGQSITTGIISALNRTVTTDTNTVLNIIQIDAAISPGNSGGALVDKGGNMIGIPTAKSTKTYAENIGYVIPINDIKEKVEILCAKESKIYATDDDAIILGIRVSDSYLGPLITEINQGSKAYDSKLNVGDIVLSVNGDSVKTAEEFVRAIRFCKKGDAITLTIKRPEGKEYKTYKTTIKT